MKNRFSLLNLLASAVLLLACLTSCDKGDFLVPEDDPATRTVVVPIDPPVDPPVKPPLLIEPIYCEVSGIKVDGSRLYVGTSYEFTLQIYTVLGDDPVFGMRIVDAAGNAIKAVLGSKEIMMTFLAPGEYTVYGDVIRSTGTSTDSRTFQVVEPGAQGPVKVGQLFSLYVNNHGRPAADTKLLVKETMFNDPQCTIKKLSDDFFQICINEPGAYQFTPATLSSGFKPLYVPLPISYCVDVFYRPFLECISTRISPGVYENFLQRPPIKYGEFDMFGFFEQRICCGAGYGNLTFAGEIDPDTGFGIIRPYPLRASRDDINIKFPNTSIQLNKRVYVEGESSFIPSDNTLKVTFPQDRRYTLEKVVDIGTVGDLVAQ